MRFTRIEKRESCTCHRKKYIEKVLERFRMNNSKPMSTLVTAHFRLLAHLSPQSEDEQFVSHVSYSSALGSRLGNFDTTHESDTNTTQIYRVWVYAITRL